MKSLRSICLENAVLAVMTNTKSDEKMRRAYGGQSIQQRQRERRERFEEAGLELFGTLGLKNTTVRALCKEANLTERYFYESFDNTETLFCAVYERQHTELQTYFASEIPKLPAELKPRVRAALELYFKKMEDPRIPRILYLEALVGSNTIIAMRRTKLRAQVEFSAHLIKIDNPELTTSHEVLSGVSLAICGAVQTVAVDWVLGNYTAPLATVIDSCTLAVLGIMQALRNQA